MDDEEAARQKRRVNDLHEKWVGPLGLGWWVWEYEWYRNQIDNHPDALFNIQVRFEYHDVTLQVSLGHVKQQSDLDLERSFVHELGHCFTLPLRDAASQGVNQEGMRFLEEHQATEISSSLLWLREHLTKKEPEETLAEHPEHSVEETDKDS